MKAEDFDNSAFCTMHENCKKCLLKDCCNVWKHYKALKENGHIYACDLICFMQHLDYEAMSIYKYLTAGNKAFILSMNKPCVMRDSRFNRPARYPGTTNRQVRFENKKRT